MEASFAARRDRFPAADDVDPAVLREGAGHVDPDVVPDGSVGDRDHLDYRVADRGRGSQGRCERGAAGVGRREGRGLRAEDRERELGARELGHRELGLRAGLGDVVHLADRLKDPVEVLGRVECRLVHPEDDVVDGRPDAGPGARGTDRAVIDLGGSDDVRLGIDDESHVGAPFALDGRDDVRRREE